MFEVENLGYWYTSLSGKKKFGISNINFTIEKGYIYGLAGRNGAGKTTLLKSIIRGDYSCGEVIADGVRMSDNPIELKEKMGFIMYPPMLLDNRTARENGEIFGKLYSGWNQKRYIEKLNEFQVDKDVCIDTLSKGNIMKVMAAFEWGHRPELLIADEPTAGFDPVFRKKFLRYLQEYVEDGEHSVIISTHITEDLDKIADYIMMIDDGKIILNDTIENIRDNYGIVKCTQEEFEKLQKEMPEENIFGYRNNGEKTEALIKIQKDICVGYDVRRPNITEILVYLTQKGENNDGQD